MSPRGTKRLSGTHHLRPILPPQLPRYWQTYPRHPMDPDNAPWDHPFDDLWRYAQELSLSHISRLTLDSRPRFLLTGPVWISLYNLQCLHQPWHPPTYADLRQWGRSLHVRLDYPALGGMAGPRPDEPLNDFQLEEIVPRALIVTHLRKWIHNKRQRKSRIRRHLIYTERILPPHITDLAHVVTFIAECL